MPAMKNARHEAFAQALASGKSQAEAYALAGYRPSEPNASRLTRNEKVRARVAEIQGKAAQRAVVTVESLAAELEEARALALKSNQSAAAVSATMGKAKLFGLLVEKREHSGPKGGPIQTIDLSHATDEQLDALAALLDRATDAAGDPEGGDPEGA